MTSSRRNFLRSLGMGAAGGAVVQWPVGPIPAAYAFASTRTAQLDGPVLLG